MSKIAVVYWSGTGNTEAMAGAVAEGAKGKGAEVSLLTSAEFDASMMDEGFTAAAFGCPAMGAEVLEESEFDPMFEGCKPVLGGKRSACSGPTGRETASGCGIWQDACLEAGADLAADPVICNEAPDDAALEECKALGASLVS